MKWDDQGNLLTVPQGYTPIYNEEELRKIGVKNTDGDYNYTNSDGKNYEYSLSANYILMTDINLTPGYDPATALAAHCPIKISMTYQTKAIPNSGHPSATRVPAPPSKAISTAMVIPSPA